MAKPTRFSLRMGRNIKRVLELSFSRPRISGVKSEPDGDACSFVVRYPDGQAFHVRVNLYDAGVGG